jgi:hypothetical protein
MMQKLAVTKFVDKKTQNKRLADGLYASICSRSLRLPTRPRLSILEQYPPEHQQIPEFHRRQIRHAQMYFVTLRMLCPSVRE